MTNNIGLFIVYFIAGYIVVSFLFFVTKKRNSDDSNKDEQEHETTSYKKEWFDILEIDKTSTLDEIKKAYKNKMKAYHPDRVAGLGEEFSTLAEEKSKEINMAYDEALKSKR